jgi:hypothetical protein
MTIERYPEEFQQLAPEQSFEEELPRQHLAVAREANEIARSASYSASDAAAAARLQGRVAIAAQRSEPADAETGRLRHPATAQ